MNIKLVNQNFKNDYIDNLLYSRGIKNINLYKNPTQECLDSPGKLKNIAIGAALYLRVVLSPRPNILVVVDADCDGYTSAAIMYQYTKQVNCHAQVDYLLHEGKQHGLQDHIDKLLKENKQYDLIILPDSSSNDATYHDMLDQIHIPCLVIDHHIVDKQLSDNAIVINNQMSPNYQNKELVGAGMAFQFCRYIDTKLDTNWANQYIDLAALGQIGDMGSVIPLQNRYIIQNGLNNIKNQFFIELIKKQAYSITGESAPSQSLLNKKLNAISIAFYIVPLINALIRVGTQQEKKIMFEAFINGDALIDCNKRGAKGTQQRAAVEATRICVNAKSRQQKLRDEISDKLEQKIIKENLLDNKILFIEIDNSINCPSELTGLIAMNLCAKHNIPTIICREIDGELKGSIRGINNGPMISFKKFLQNSKLCNFVAGHDMAAGIGIYRNNVNQLISYANNELENTNFGESSYEVNFKRNIVDSDLNSLIIDISKAGSLWGQNCPQPLIYIEKFNFNGNNIKIMGTSKDTVKFDINGITCIKFKAKDLIKQLDDIGYSGKIELVCEANLNEWGGRSTPQLFIQNYKIIKDNLFEF